LTVHGSYYDPFSAPESNYVQRLLRPLVPIYWPGSSPPNAFMAVSKDFGAKGDALRAYARITPAVASLGLAVPAAGLVAPSAAGLASLSQGSQVAIATGRSLAGRLGDLARVHHRQLGDLGQVAQGVIPTGTAPTSFFGLVGTGIGTTGLVGGSPPPPWRWPWE
jgi:hypothetical protein